MDSSKAIVLLEGEMTSLQELLDESNPYVSNSSLPLSTLKMYERSLNEGLQYLDVSWSKNFALVTEQTDIDKLQRTYRALTRGVRNSLVQLQKTIDDVIKATVPLTTVSTVTPTIPPPKLPALKIPEFRGIEDEWIAFWDIFESLVHSRTDIDNVVKFSTLRTSLKDNAFKAIEGLPITNDNYAVAVKTLKDRYANKENLKRKLMSKLTHLASPCHDFEELTTFKLEYEKLILQLGNLNIDTDAMGPIFSNILCEKLPSETRKMIANKYNSMSLGLKEISDGLKYVCDLMEFCNESDSHKNSKERHMTAKMNSRAESCRSAPKGSPKARSYNNYASYSKNNQNSNVSQLSNISSSSNVSSPSNVSSSSNVSHNCIFCFRSHASRDCRNFDTVDKRRDRIRELGLCFACLKSGHMYSDCRNKPRCKICDGPHYPMVCKRVSSPINPTSKLNVNSTNVSHPHDDQSVATKDNSNDKGASPVVSSASLSVNQTFTSDLQLASTALPTATVLVSGNGQRSNERALFDIGSQRSFVSADLARKLDLDTVANVTVKVKPFGKEAFDLECRIVRIVVRLGRTRTVVHAYEYTDMNSSIHSPGLAKTVSFLASKGVKLADEGLNSDEIDNVNLVIGVDYFSRFIKGQRIISGIELLNSSGGALIYGKLPSWASERAQVNQIHASHVFCGKIAVSEVKIDSCCDVKKLWDLESAGINMSETTPEERNTVESFNESVRYVNDKYEVSLPFKNELRPPVNYRIAIAQLNSLLRKFETDNSFYENYNSILLEYVQLGFIELVPDKSPIKGHYLPHHAVKKDSETTPLRIVFNASSKAKGELSLNDCLQTGPSLTTKLYQMLVNFRVNPLAAIADISKAFLRIGLSPECRDFCRFLWVTDPSDPTSVITYRFCVICFGATSSPFILQQTLLHHFSLHDNELALSLMENFYVDNFIKTYKELDVLLHEYPIINEILGRANMPLREWASNDSYFNQLVNNDKETMNVLGLEWNLNDDKLSLKPVDCTFKGTLTKRKALSIISRMFDPLGIFSPIQIRGKIFIQSLWQNHYGWDDPLSGSFCDEFNEICNCLSDVHKITFNRFVIVPNICMLHIFCDASMKAYGAVAYVVDPERGSNLLLSKARVAPHPKQTIPRLELTALSLGVKLAHNLMSNPKLKLSSCTVWSDSTVAICWVRNNNSKIPYVRNRVKEIHDSNFPVRFVPTKDNPADFLSRGLNFRKLKDKPLWWNGPEWLIGNSIPDQILPEEVNMNELLAEPLVIQPPPPLIDVSKYSSLRMLRRIVKLLLMFIANCRNNKLFKFDELFTLVYLEQQQHFSATISYLKDRTCTGTPTDVKNFCVQLNLFVDDNGLIRSKGRLKNSSLSYDAQCPVLLPPKSHLTWLFVDRLHRSNHHCGVNTLLVLLREKFWLPKARQVIKRIVSSCLLCQIITKDRIRMPPPPPLPSERVKYDRPFQCVGVDYTGAINVVDYETGEEERVFVCLFTCTATRAIHLELTHTMSASDFLLSFRRFVGYHSVPSLIISDNGRNFVGFNNFLKEIKDEREVTNYLDHNSIEWKFITPRAPWTGGFYERLIGVVKGCLSKALYRKRVSFEELRTLLVEFQTIVNTRPLTYISQERDSEALTPSMLLYGRNILISPPLNDLMYGDPDYVCASDLREQYARLSSVIQKYEHSWCRDYLLSLRERHYNSRDEISQRLRVGDIVMVDLEDHLNKGHRSLLTIGKITQLYTSSDNVVRTVEILASGRLYIRPISKLIYLELSQPGEHKLAGTPPNDDLAGTSNTLPRKRRRAAIRCDAERKELLVSDLI